MKEENKYLEWLHEVTIRCYELDIKVPDWLYKDMQDVFKAGFTPDEAIEGVKRRLVLGQHFENEGK